MDLIPDFIERKHGRAEVKYPHPLLESVLAPTYGVVVYQEQVMQTAQILAGYSLGGADLLRRAMGKKKVEAMAKERAKFEAGALAHLDRSEEHTSELQSLMRISYAVFCLKTQQIITI